MTRKTKIKKLKLFIKISIISFVLVVFITFGFFIKPTRFFDNANRKTWLRLSDQERIMTVQHIIPDIQNQELLISCVTEIAQLPGEKNEMIIRDAVVLCYNGIKINTKNE